MVYARPADDLLPQPGACLVTGITPQKARDVGVCEADFFAAIHDELARPGTCALGYNSIRFDDEFTRYGLYRNFFDPYAREWRNGNSRWDLIDVARLAHALRPEGIEWPKNEEGVTSFRLELLTAANDIPHEGAHDALADVRATIELARLLKTRQPRLFDFVFQHRDKNWLARQLNVQTQQPVAHVSAKYPARLGCIAVVVPLAWHPRNRNGVIVYDLRVDPEPLIELSVEAIRRRLYTPTNELPEGESRIPLKMVSINHAPVVVPVNTLTGEAREKWDLDETRERRNWRFIRENTEAIRKKIEAVFNEQPFEPATDPDQSLYDGFLSDHDRRLCEQVRATPPDKLAGLKPPFEAAKLHELLFRYRARNWPETLNRDERARWDEYRRHRLTHPQGGSSITLAAYRKELARLTADKSTTGEQRAVVNALIEWPIEIGL